MALRNLITDVAGVRIGHAEDARLASGVTAVVFDEPAVASVDVRGGGSGTRETALLDPAQTVEGIDAIALSGGSAFGLDAGSGVQAWLRAQGRGFAVGAARVPIVPGAILFDLLNGGDKSWDRYPPYRELGYAAAAAANAECALGSVGAGLGATTVNLKGGIGSASATVDGVTVGAIAAVNAAGSVTVGDTPQFWAAAYEQNDKTAHALVKRAAELLTETVSRLRTTSDNGPLVLAGSVAGESSPVGRLLRQSIHDRFHGEVLTAHDGVGGATWLALGALDPALATRDNHTRLVAPPA